MSDTTDRAIYDAAVEVREATLELATCVKQVRDQLEEIWGALDGIRKEIAAANERVDKLKF